MNNLINRTRPDAVVNCAAYTDVDKAETDYAAAYSVNASGPKILAQACNRSGIELVHISTDYVFSGEAVIENGRRRPYVETDICGPVTAYGKSKLDGEKFVTEYHDRWYILRTAWLYGEGRNFVKTMLAAAKNRKTLYVVCDQTGTPTSAADLANTILSLLGTRQYGLYHATNEGQCTWYDFAEKISELSKIKMNVVPISSKEYPRPAKRPKWSVLENANLKSIGKNSFCPWEEALSGYLIRKGG